MLILLSSSELNVQLGLGDPQAEAIDQFRNNFIEKYGEEVYTKASKIVIVEENFFNVIKDRYGPVLIGEHNDFLDDLIERHLDV
jgi:hypothetical protein